MMASIIVSCVILLKGRVGVTLQILTIDLVYELERSVRVFLGLTQRSIDRIIGRTPLLN